VNVPVGGAAACVEEYATREVLLGATVVPDVVKVPAAVEAVWNEDGILLLLKAIQLPRIHCLSQSLRPQTDRWAEMPEIRASMTTETLIAATRLTSIAQQI
jgi:hypothetical protein